MRTLLAWPCAVAVSGTCNVWAFSSSARPPTIATAADPPPNTTAHDFTSFEEDLLPRWVDSFRVNQTPGAFTWTPAHNETSLYGATDLVYLLFRFVRCLVVVDRRGARFAWDIVSGRLIA
jgi:hypothetical protein